MTRRKKAEGGATVKARDPLPYPFGQKRKRKLRKHTRVIAWHRHLCNGGLHAVGLTNKGQLVFSHHTPAELTRQVMLMEFGESTHKCAMAYRDWVLGKEYGTLDETLRRERLVWNTYSTRTRVDPDTRAKVEETVIVRPPEHVVLAYKIMQKRRGRRLESDYRPVAELLSGKTLKNVWDKDKNTWVQKETGGFSLADVEATAEVTASTLRGWGWIHAYQSGGDVNYKLRPLTHEPKERSYHQPERVTLVDMECAQVGANRLVRIKVWARATSDATINLSNRTCWDFRYVCDMAEAKLLRTMLERQRLYWAEHCRAQLEAKAAGWNQQLDLAGLAVACDDRDSATFKVTCTMQVLTAQGAYRIARAIRDLAGRGMASFDRAAKKRLAAAMRTPAKPWKGVGIHPDGFRGDPGSRFH